MREIEVVPNKVVLSLSVTTKDGKSPLPAKSENDKRTRAILKAIKSHRIEDKYIKIDCLVIHAVFSTTTNGWSNPSNWGDQRHPAKLRPP